MAIPLPAPTPSYTALTSLASLFAPENVPAESSEWKKLRNSIHVVCPTIWNRLASKRVYRSASIEELSGRWFLTYGVLVTVAFGPGCVISCIECGAFGHVSLSSICIPYSVGILGRYCFHKCDLLAQVSLRLERGSRLRELRNRAFRRCASLLVSAVSRHAAIY
jgi:hypothetical protein